MAKFDFDKVIDRRGTGALKTDLLTERFGRDDLKPMWIADMDFLSPPAITEAIIERAKHGIFGYTAPSQGYYNSIINWLDGYHNWKVEKEWLTFIPGVVKGIAFTIDCFMEKDEKVVIQPPVYPPFRCIPDLHKRIVVKNHLKFDGNQYQMDFENLTEVLDNKCKVFILCNPHNPAGRVWSKEDLIKLADICYERNILVISDEIHSDLAFEGHTHTPFASVSEKAAMNSITFMAPSKTFNIAGIISSFSVIPNPEIRAKFNAYLECSELATGHIFAYTATEAAYNEGREWLEEAKKYIWENVTFTDKYLKENIPLIKAIIPEASFLIWLDCRALNCCQTELVNLFVNDAKLALNDGVTFGIDGEGFMRFNVGTPRSIVEKALINLKNAIDKKQN